MKNGSANYGGGGAAERSVERFRKDVEDGNGEVYAPLRPYAIAVTGAALGGSGVAGLATSATGRAFLAMLGIGMEVQGAADGLPPGGRGIAGAEAKALASDAKWSVDSLVNAANKPVAENGLSAAARKLTSHAQREGGTFVGPTGSISQQNAFAEKTLRQIIENPTAIREQLGRGGLEIRMPNNGQGVRYNADGSFSGFVDPRR